MQNPLVLAHRGFSGKYPENTRAAFLAAVAAGADGFETDVHLSKDGQLVVVHDPILGRTCDGSGAVAGKTYKELLAYDFGAWFHPDFTGERIMRIEEVLELVKEHKLVLNIEIKNYEIVYEGIEEALIALINRMGMKESVFLSSFNHLSMVKCKGIDSTIQTGLLYGYPLYKAEEYILNTHADNAHPRYFCFEEEPDLVERFHAKGRGVHTWTVNEPEDMRRMISLGTDSVITNYPDLLIEILKGVI